MLRCGSILLAITLALAGFACSDSSNEQALKAKAEARRLALRATIADFAERSNADLSWIPVIAAASASVSKPLYSVDLERVWLIGRPIVFVGALTNVATENDTDYQVTVTHSDVFTPELRLQLLCAKDWVAPVLIRIKSDKDPRIHPGGIAVAAKISRVTFVTEPEREGAKRIFVGHGRCVDIAYLGDAFFLGFILRDTSNK